MDSLCGGKNWPSKRKLEIDTMRLLWLWKRMKWTSDCTSSNISAVAQEVAYIALG